MERRFPNAAGRHHRDGGRRTGVPVVREPHTDQFKVPDQFPLGLVVVSTAAGIAALNVPFEEIAPSLNLLDSRHVAGIILRNDGSGAYGGGAYDILGPNGTSLGYKTVAARAGDTIELFGTGFGPTNPSVPARQAFSGAAPITSTLTLSINSVTVLPTFAGLSGAGLDQVNLTLPSGLGSGDLPLTASVGNFPTQAAS